MTKIEGRVNGVLVVSDDRMPPGAVVLTNDPAQLLAHLGELMRPWRAPGDFGELAWIEGGEVVALRGPRREREGRA